ncbi:MAG: hypothetical protein R3C03_23215 [Pirellulaceae bacterium]
MIAITTNSSINVNALRPKDMEFLFGSEQDGLILSVMKIALFVECKFSGTNPYFTIKYKNLLSRMRLSMSTIRGSISQVFSNVLTKNSELSILTVVYLQ